MARLKPVIKLKPVIIWKDICIVPGYEQFTNYEISTTGLVRNKTTNYILQSCTDSRGYVSITLSSPKKTLHIHRAVAIVFCPNPENYPNVDHENGKPFDNNLSNLRWVNQSQNGMNAKMPSNNTTGYKNIQSGYNHQKPVWKIRICVKGKIHVKYFQRDSDEVPQHVIECRDQMLKDLHKDFACFRI